MVVLVVFDTDRAESTVHAIQAVPIASRLKAAYTVQLAFFKEALSEQSFQPWRPPVVLFITGFLVFENRALEVLMKRTTGGLHG